MPPDRNSQHTSASPVASGSQQTAKEKAQSIARGLACQQCRKRKVKCNSGKPACSGCIKASAKGEPVDCVYDDLTAPKRKRSSPGTVLALQAANDTLQAKVEELEAYIAKNRSDFPLTPDTSSGSPQDLASSSKGSRLCDVRLDPAGSSYAVSAEFVPENLGDANLPESPMADLWSQLIYPGWPKDLPSFELTSRLLEVWFYHPHCCSGMINADKFRAAMLHPPTTAAFPHSALIHAMMAIASMLVSEDFFNNEPRYWPLGQKVTQYHASRAKVGLDQAIAHGERLLQVSQAVTIMCFWSYSQARFVEVWLYCGMATRILTPLGLNQLAVPHDNARPKMHLLGPPKDDDELYERSMNMWYALMSDRMATACTGWPHSFSESDVLSLLPTFGPSSLAGDIETSPLSSHSPAFLLAHPPHLVGPLQLELKSVVLLGRVNTFAQRAALRADRDSDRLKTRGTDIRNTDAFRKLENDIIGFQSSIPREYQPSSNAIITDPRLHMVHSIPPATMLLLHERFVTHDENDASMPKCLKAVDQILQALHVVMSTSFEIGLLSPFITFIWGIAGRTLTRQLAFLKARNQPGGDQIRSDVLLIIRALQACKSPLGASSAAHLEALLEDCFRALPNSGWNACPAPPPEPAVSTGTSSSSSFMSYTTNPSPNWPSSASSVSSNQQTSGFPLTPPHLASANAYGNLRGGTVGELDKAKTFQEIDETLQQGWFEGLGEQVFGDELDRLIRGSRSSAPWHQPPQNTSMQQQQGDAGGGGGRERFEEIDGTDLIRMSTFGATSV